MKIHNSIGVVFLMLVFSFTTMSAQTMYVNQKGGIKVSFDVNSVNLMKFSSGNLNVVKLDKSVYVYALTSLQHVNFGDFDTAIPEVSSYTNELSVFPNPVVDILNIKNTPSEGSTLIISSLEGKQMLTMRLDAIGNSSINVSQFPQGFYLCKLFNGTKVLTTKFLKQ